MTKKTRTIVASIWRYSAIPPQTPATTLLVVLRSRRVCMCLFPSIAKRVEDGDAERREQAQRDRGLRREFGDRQEQRRDRDDRVDRGHDQRVAARRQYGEDRGPQIGRAS